MASILATCVRESIIAELASSEELQGISKALELQHLAIPARTLEKTCPRIFTSNEARFGLHEEISFKLGIFSQQKHHHLHFLVFHLAPKASLFR